MKLTLQLALIALTAVLTGCAMPSAIKSGTTAEELLQKLGKPTEVRPGPQGGESWDYVYGPEGRETWRYDLDAGRKVSTATQLLTEERLQKIIAGSTTQDEVRQLLGKPREMVVLGGETYWEWRVGLTPDYGVFVVRFAPNGIVNGYNVLRDDSGDGKDSGP